MFRMIFFFKSFDLNREFNWNFNC